MEINEDIIGKAKQMVADNLETYQKEINEAFMQMDEILDVNLKVRFSMNKGKFKIQSDISFTSEKIKDSQTFWYDPHQPELFSMEEPPAEASLSG